MALPITVPYTFGNATTAIPLSNLDSDYATVYQAVNGIGNGSVALANVAITGGTISGNTTASNVTVSSGTFTNVTLSNVTILSVSTPITAAEGGTGSSSAFTANGVVYASSTSALATGSALQFNGSNLGVGGTADSFGRGYGNVIGVQSASTAAIEIDAATGSSAYFDMGVNGTRYFNINSSSSSTSLTSVGSYPLIFGISGAETMRINTSGYLGIGTSSPSATLDILSNATANGVNLASSGGNIRYIVTDGTYTLRLGIQNGSAAYVGTFSNTNLQVATNGNYVATFDTSGNLGLGVTPSAWLTSYSNKAMQIGPVGAIYGNSVSTGNQQMVVGNNVYLDSSATSRYITSDYATKYQQYGGLHAWYNAPSGTAGNAITFTQAMTLDNSGNLLVGATSTPSGVSSGLVVNNNFTYGKSFHLASGASITINVKQFTYGVGNLTVGGVVGSGSSSVAGFYLLRWNNNVVTVTAATNIAVTCADGISGQASVTITNNTGTTFDGSVIINTCS